MEEKEEGEADVERMEWGGRESSISHQLCVLENK